MKLAQNAIMSQADPLRAEVHRHISTAARANKNHLK